MNDHTLLIPTFNRPALLARLLRYYRARDGGLSILVLDSSKPGIAQENAGAVSAYGGRATHVTFPESEPPASKLMRGLQLVESRYVSFCADDDLVFEEGLEEAVAFLRDHADYVCAHGLYLNFRQEGRDVHVSREYGSMGIEADDPGARIFRLLQKYESMYYGLFRTADLREIFAAASKIPTLVFQELFQSVATLIRGKTRRFPRFYVARQDCAPAQLNRDKWQTHYWFSEHPGEVLEHYHFYRDQVCAFYEAHASGPRLPRDALLRTLDLAHAVYFSAGCSPAHFYSALQSYWPAEPYVDAAHADIFDRFSGARARRLDLPRIATRAQNLLERIRAAPALLDLGRRAKLAGGVRWRCRPQPSLRFMVSTPEFRKAFVELCLYLNAA
jgi:glycosyltransferase domain-containing protein